ncbi:MAG: XRE family transcriptional regulator [Sphaerochaeta sp.]
MTELPRVGKTIQRLRAKQKLTLQLLAERSGVSRAMLSQIEAENVNPTIATIWKISRGLNVELNDLLTTTEEPRKVFALNPAENTQPPFITNTNGVAIRILTPLAMVQDLEMYLITLEAHASLESKPHVSGTQEYLTVVKGNVEVLVEENHARLKKGDYIIYHCDVVHTIKNPTDHVAQIHLVVRYEQNH